MKMKSEIKIKIESWLCAGLFAIFMGFFFSIGQRIYYTLKGLL